MKLFKTTLICSAILSSTLTMNANATEEGNWFLRPIISLSNLSDTSGQINYAGDIGASQVATDSGFSAGLGLGYQYNSNLAVEFFWEYRTNDSDTTVPDNSVIAGNYASNIFYLNGFYYFDQAQNSNWKTYVGAGLGWVQEIDIDLEINSTEESYSGDGQTAFQLFAGTQYALGENLDLQFELRYGNVGSIDMTNEISNVPFNGLDYKTTSLQVGLVYEF